MVVDCDMTLAVLMRLLAGLVSLIQSKQHRTPLHLQHRRVAGSRACSGGLQDGVDRDMAVKLAEAAGQAVWGSAYHTINHPGGIKATHLSLLSHMALHTVE